MSAENADRPAAGGAPVGVPAALPPLSGSKLALGTIALSLATFMNVLDTSIANVSIPAIAGDLGVSPNQGTWIITSFAVANAISVPLTGWLTDNYSWPWIFFINVPVGAVALIMTASLYRGRETERVQKPIDVVGLALLVVWVGALQLTLDKGKDLDWFSSPEIVALAVAAALAFCLFLVWELTEEHPVVDLSLFRNRNFSTGTLAIALAYGAYFGSIVLLPLWLQQYMGYTATDAGLVLAPVGVLALLLTPIVGRTTGKVDPRLYATTSMVVFAAVAWMRSRFNTQVDLWTLVVPTIVQGAAVSCFFIPLVNLALGGLRPDQIAAATGLNNFLRITAGAFATSTATTMWENRAALHHAHLVEHLTPGDPTTSATLELLARLGLQPEQRYAYLDRLVNQQAFTLSALDLFYGSAIILMLIIPFLWIARPPKGGGSAEAAGAH